MRSSKAFDRMALYSTYMYAEVLLRVPQSIFNELSVLWFVLMFMPQASAQLTSGALRTKSK